MTLGDFFQGEGSRWLTEEGPESDIVLSSRVRIARNLMGHNFPMLSSAEEQAVLVDEVAQAASAHEVAQLGPFSLLRMWDVSDIDKQVLVEKHLISPALAQSGSGGALLSTNGELSVLINEEDHLRLQCLEPGYQLETAYNQVDRLDDAFEATLEFSFDEEKGYLTACPTNVGTGMRASVMMHLPVLVVTGQINRILSAVTQVGLAVRGIFGEGSDAQGNLFQVSNQITLGQSEQEIIGNLQGVTRQIIEHERNARQRLFAERRSQVEDRVCRSFGILAYARQVDSKEAMQRLSDVRLGIDLGIIKGVSASILKELMVAIQPGFLQKYYEQEMTPVERDIKRAALIRERLRTDGFNADL